MTILENELTPARHTLTIVDPPKRKQPFGEYVAGTKKFAFGGRMNGYRADGRNTGGDAGQDSPVATLSNMGNTCFLNSVLYTLRFAPTFLHNLHHLIGDLALVNARLSQNKAKTSSLGRNVGAITGPSSRSTSSKDLLSLGNSDVIPKSKVQIVTEKLHELFVTMHNLEVKESTDPYQPVALLQAIREANYIFEGNQQQDAHELLVYLLDNIRETCEVLTQQVQHNPELLNDAESAQSNNSKLWSVRRSWKKSHKKKDKDKNAKETIAEEQTNGGRVADTDDVASVDSNGDATRKKLGYNFVVEDFQGVTLRRTKCSECECVTERKEPFYDIPVPISTKDDESDDELTSPSDIFRRACVTTEKLCDANKYLCENCMRYNEASREVLFEKLPNIMVLQLKRFTTSTAGVQKVNTYMPTPLELECFCEGCCKAEGKETRPHRYRLCCVIMHLGGSMASGHYIAYVRASDHLEDYAECGRDLPKGSLSASSSEKSLNILKYFKPKTFGNSLLENKNALSKSVLNGVRMCRSTDCCGVRLNRSIVENVVNGFPKRAAAVAAAANQPDYWQGPSSAATVVADDMWLECDDENVRPITALEFRDELGFRQNSTSTPYLLFYAKVADVALD